MKKRKKQLYVNVRWISKESYKIEIQKNEGRLTNIRAAVHTQFTSYCIFFV